MKKIFLLISALFIFTFLTIDAQTSVPSGTVSGTWTLAGSPYLIQGNILILSGSTLTIEPGVTVNFQGSYKLNVQGQLLAIGTTTDTIIFTATNTINGWKGIRFDNTPITNDTSRIKYCKIQYGKATGSAPENYGGGIFINNFSKIVISKSCIINCKAFYGAAIYFIGNNCSPVFSENKISYNTNDNEGGGAIFSDYGSSPEIAFNSIFNNAAVGASGQGGGITSVGGAIIKNNVISNNSSEMYGGGINCNSCNGVISNNIISSNSAVSNIGGGKGGGVYCSSISYPIFEGNIISNNIANKGGGYSFNSASNAIISESIICNNTANEYGGAIFCETGAVPVFKNTTITNNAAINGGALYCIGNATPIFSNCILYGNTASQGGDQAFLYDDNCDPTFQYSNIQGGSAAIDANGNYYSGVYQNNINTNPLFVNPSVGSGNSFNGVSANWSLQNTSPCIDAGNPNGIYSETDIAGNHRITVCIIDIGAYEYQTGIPLTISISVSQPILCYGAETGELEATVTSGTGAHTYLWSNGQTTAKATGLIPGNYSVTVSEASTGCTIVKNFTLNPPPMMSWYADAGVDQTIICGGSAQLLVNPYTYNGNLPISYKWIPSFGLNSDTISNPIATVITDTKYIAIITTPEGCFKQDSVTVFVNALIANAGGNKTTVCDGIIQFDNVSSNYTGTDSLAYYWSPSTGLNNDSIQNPTSTIITDVTYTVLLNTSNGCIATDTIKVHVTPLTTDAGMNKTLSCGSWVPIGNVTTNYTGNSVLEYNWTPSTGLNNDTIVNPITTAFGITYTVTVSTPHGCIASDSVSINLIPMNSIEICRVGVDSANRNTIVWNKSITAIDSFYIYRETNVTNVYQRVGAVPYDSMSIFIDTLSHPDVQSNKYKISIKDSCGLESALSNYHKTMHLAINQGIGTTWNLIWDAYEGFTVSTYNIYRGSTSNNLQLIGSTSGGNSQYTDLIAPLGDVYYQVEVISPNQCNPSRSYNSSRSNIATNIPNSINEINQAIHFSIYPNPASDIVTISIEKTNTDDISLSIYNAIGALIESNLLKPNQQQINVAHLKNGMYLITLQSKNWTTSKKLIIQK